MNWLIFVIRFVSSKGDGKLKNKRILFPIIGIMLGVSTVLLTLAIMNGLEFEVFSKLTEFYSPARIVLSDPDESELLYVIDEIEKIGVGHQLGLERNAIIKAGDNFRFITVRAINNVQGFFASDEKSRAIDLSNPENENSILIGDELSFYLSVHNGETCQLLSPVDISLATSIFPSRDVTIYSTFDFDLIDVDMNYVIIPYDMGVDLFKKHKERIIYLDQKLSSEFVEATAILNDNTRYYSWENEYEALISAMKLEKFAYSIFGFIIIIISAFNMLSIMSMTVMRKIPQLGILQAIGFSEKKIASIFIIQSVFTGITGSLLGYFLARAIIMLNDKYQLLHFILKDFPISNFPLILNTHNSILIICVSFLLIVISGIFPSIQTRKLNPIQSINCIK
jgi:lipoprotein-releasing system permease protein